MNQDQNPSKLPSSDLIGPSSSLKAIVLVGPGKRFVNNFVDTLICVALKSMFVFAIVNVFDLDVSIVTTPVWGFMLLLLAHMIYYVVMEGAFSRTVGKMCTGTIVVNEQGDRPSFGQIFTRSISRYIPFEPFSCLGRESRGWHDSIAGTYVVKR